MLVFPQTFNYRLIIGTLVIAIVILGSYSISNFNSFKNQEEYLEQETKLVQNELTEMISLYEDVSVENETIKFQLEASKSKIKDILSSVNKAKIDLSLISEYRIQINALKNEREVIFDEIDSLVRDNNILHFKVDSVSKQFENQKLELVTLTKKNKSLHRIVSSNGAPSASSIEVSALNSTRSLSVFETKKLSEADQIEVCATLKSTDFSGKGNENIYVQILDSKDNIVSERGTVKLDDMYLRYSGKTTVKRKKENMKVCLKISISNKEKLSKGLYFIDVFQDATLLGSNTITLN